MNVVIPMAGDGTRFANAGYKLPKPFVDVNGLPMIERVTRTLPNAAHLILICREEHLTSYPWYADALAKIHGNVEVIITSGLTEGAACTVLLSKHLINNDDELIIANSDQLISYDESEFDRLRAAGYDGIIFTFKANHPKWSYVRVEGGLVTTVAEKVVISDDATCGVYYFKRGADFVGAAEQMIERQIRVNNEFYNAPVYNQLIESGRKIVPFMVDEMHGIGTPEDLNEYLRSHV